MTNPEALSVSVPEFTSEEKELLSIEQLDSWRASQHDTLSRLRESAKFGDDYPRVFEESIDDVLGFYLNSHNVAENSPKRDELTDLYRAASIDRIHEDEWLYRPSSRGETVDSADDMSERQAFESKIAVLKSEDLEENAEITGAHEEALRMNERWDALQIEVPEAREKLAKLAAKRQGRIFGKGGEDYVAAKQEYDAKVQELGRIKFSDETQYLDEMDNEQREQLNAKIIAYVLDEQKELRDSTTANLKGTKVGKFVEFMNRGSKKTRIAKGVGLGVITGATGAFLLAPLAAGTAVAGVATAGAAYASRFARGYAVHDKRGMGDATDEQQSTITNVVSHSNSNLFDRARKKADSSFEDDTQQEQNKRKKAVAWGVGSIAVGSVVGYALHAGVEHITSRDLSIFGGKHFGVHTNGSTHGVIDNNPTLHEHPAGGTGNTYTGPRYLPGIEPHTGMLSTHDMTSGGSTSAHSALDYFSGQSGTTEFSAGGTHNFESWMNGSNGAGYTVKPGDTVWGLSQKYLETHGVKHPSVYQTDAVKDQMLKTFQAKGFADHRGWLTAGTKVKF